MKQRKKKDKKIKYYTVSKQFCQKYESDYRTSLICQSEGVKKVRHTYLLFPDHILINSEKKTILLYFLS
mgnify:CR=1 FL=1